MIMDGVKVKVVSSHVTPSKGSAGLRTQVPGAMASVSNLASATGGFCSATSSAAIGRNSGPGNLAQCDNK